MTPGFTRNTRCLLSNHFLHLCVTTVIPSFSPRPLLPARPGLSLYCLTTLEQRLGSAWCARRHLLPAELDAAFIWMTLAPCLRAHHPTLQPFPTAMPKATNCYTDVTAGPAPAGPSPLLPDHGFCGWPTPPTPPNRHTQHQAGLAPRSIISQVGETGTHRN